MTNKAFCYHHVGTSQYKSKLKKVGIKGDSVSFKVLVVFELQLLMPNTLL